ncbi:hypothetical protein B566_EDAN010733, partial [Ephemera danica]
MMRVTFSINGPAQVDDNSNSWCLSMQRIELQIVYNYPSNAHIYTLKNELPRLFSAITEFQVIASFPPEISENDAFTELHPSCNIYASATTDGCKMSQNIVTFLLTRRYDEIISLSQIKEDFILKRQVNVEYFRFLLASRVSHSNASGNDIKAVAEGNEIPSFPNMTHLFLSQCSITYFRP